MAIRIGVWVWVGLWACAEPAAQPKPEVFKVAVPRLQTQVETREYVGEVHAIQRAEIKSRIQGRVEAVAVDEGQAVAAGQLLFTISARELKQDLRRARAAVASATAEHHAATLERAQTQMLLDRGVVSAAEMALLEAKIQLLAAKIEEARADEEQAVINLSYAEVRAPFAGQLNRVPHKVGSVVEAGTLLTTLLNASEVLVYFRVSEREHLEYTSAAPPESVALTLANGARLEGGVMDAAETEFDRGTGTIAFRARFPNPQGLLKHGSTGKVVVERSFPDALTIPQQATFEVQDHLYVYVVEEGVARARRVVPQARLAERFVLRSGLTAGERFVAEGVQKLKDGAPIQMDDAPITSRL